MNDVAPGWYQDPADPLCERLWDGDEWTDRTRPRRPQVDAPPAPQPAAQTGHAADDTPAPVTFGSAVREGFSRFADFDGRSSVAAYWYFWLFSAVVTVLTVVTLGPLGGIVGLVFFFPSLAFAVRRLHDRGKSGAYLLVNFIPILGTILVLVELAGTGDEDDNQYGPPPGRTGAGGMGGNRAGAPSGGTLLYDTGNPSDPNRYLELAPAGWHRTVDDPLVTFEEAVELLNTDPAIRAAGWRLPTPTEADWISTKRRTIRGLSEDYYWTSDRNGARAHALNLGAAPPKWPGYLVAAAACLFLVAVEMTVSGPLDAAAAVSITSLPAALIVWMVVRTRHRSSVGHSVPIGANRKCYVRPVRTFADPGDPTPPSRLRRPAPPNPGNPARPLR